MTQKSVLIVGLDPTLLDFSHPDFAQFPGLNAELVLLGINTAAASLTELGYDVHQCLTAPDETADAVLREQLKQKPFDCVMIGAGVRAAPSNFLLFERLVNVAHEHAPQAKICFNTRPSDSAEAVQRWL